ncbi:hypothetical protein [Streptomyces griseorubiginosus]|uniref:Uncharacterized protein n=1 Tax=Streptomyces griseorubiginosus TaxID=67304 RepID=A0AAI8L8D5_9ACTN|nr:hypothetical protein [Streptomyces griseorubiginosus]AYC43166.1 hypothetical protein DWG14_07472 [Streptomyces griseorubiginosus]
MLPWTANEDSSRTSFWPRVREFAVPASMIETATARRLAGDWAGACAAAGFDIDLTLRAVARDHGRDLMSRLRADLRALAPDLLRWHMPRIAPDGLLRPGLTLTLARYEAADGPVHLVARTAPAWADSGQRISLALWSRSSHDAVHHPHPRPNRRFRLDLHRHLWDAGRVGELWERSGAGGVLGRSGGGEFPGLSPAGEALERAAAGEPGQWSADGEPRQWSVPGGPWSAAGEPQQWPVPGGPRRWSAPGDPPRQDAAGGFWQGAGPGDPQQWPGSGELTWEWFDGGRASSSGAASLAPLPDGCAVDRWAAEARILLGAEGRSAGRVLVRCGGRQRLVWVVGPHRAVPVPCDGPLPLPPVLPDAATWILPDLELLRTGAIEADRLHPLVAEALVPGHAATGPPPIPDRPGRPHTVECRGARHRIGLVDGVLAPLDHDPDEIRREELLVALTGTPLPCLQAIDEAHRRPHCLDGVRERLAHGDLTGALAVVEGLLGPEALLRPGPLREALEAAAHQRITYGLFRTGMTGPGPAWYRPTPNGRRPRDHRTRPRRATPR